MQACLGIFQPQSCVHHAQPVPAALADRDGFILDAPPLADAICHDLVLKRLKLIALPSDDSLLPRWGAAGDSGHEPKAVHAARPAVCAAPSAPQRQQAACQQALQAGRLMRWLTPLLAGCAADPLPTPPAPAACAAPSRQGKRGFPHWGLWQQRNLWFQRDIMAFMAEGKRGRARGAGTGRERCSPPGPRWLPARPACRPAHSHPHSRAAGRPPARPADTPGMLTAVAGRLTGSAAIFDADWDPAAGLPGNLAIGEGAA